MYVDFFVRVWDSVLSPMRHRSLTIWPLFFVFDRDLFLLCVSMRLALNNPVRRLVAHSDMKAITSGNRMSLTGCKGLGIVSVKSNRLMFFNNLVGSL